MPEDAHAQEAKRRAIEQRLRNADASTLEKVLSIVSGAAEGFAEQSRAADLPTTAREAVEKAIDTGRELEAGIGMGAPAHPSGGAPATDQAAPPARVEEGATRLQRLAQGVSDAAHRAATAGTALKHDARETARAVASELRAVVAGFALAGILGLFALAVATGLAITFLNAILGWPWGTLIVLLVYVIAAIAAYAWARSGVEGAKRETRDGIREAKEDIRRIPRPVRDATRRGPGA